MRKTIFTLLFTGLFLSVLAQTSPPPTTTTPKKPATASPQKPKAPPPNYVSKIAFEEKMTAIEEKISNLGGSVASVNRKMEARKDSIYLLRRNIDTIVKLLQGMNIKVELTSDSLVKTSFSMADYRAKTDKDIEELKSDNSSLKTMLLIPIAGVIILLVLLIIMFRMLNHKIASKMDNIEDDMLTFTQKIDADFNEIKDSLKNSVVKELELSKSLLDTKIIRTRNEMVDFITQNKNLINSSVAGLTFKVNKQIDELKADIEAKILVQHPELKDTSTTEEESTGV